MKMLALLVTFTLIPASPFASSLNIINGDFEVGADPGPTSTRLAAGANDITGWTILPAAVEYVGGFWEAASGTRWVELDGAIGEAGGIQQLLATTPGETYTIAFDMAGSTVFGAPFVKMMRVQAAGAEADYAFSVVGRSAQDMGWVTHTFTFTAVSSQTALRFLSINDPAGIGPALDNVREAATVPVSVTTWGAIKALFRGDSRQP